jgi:hypothetical protein
MSELPWLLVYGSFVWPAVLAIAALVACALAWSDARHGGRRSLDWGRRELARPAREALADGARSVVTGTLVVEGDAVEGFDAPAPAGVTTARADRQPDSLKDALDRAASVRAPSLAIRGEDGSLVHLDGPVAVLAGSREVWTGSVLSRLAKPLRERVEAADEAGAAMLTQHHVVLASVQAGDRVQAFGKLVARQDIRTVAVRWSLAPAPEPTAAAGEVALAAIPLVHEGEARVSGPMPRALVRVSALAALGAFVGVVALGEFMHVTARGGAPGSATVTTREDQPLAFRSVSNDLIAAATPFRRTSAARRIAAQARRFPHSDADVRALAALWSLTDDCHAAVEVLTRAGRHEEAMTAAERCGTPSSRWIGAQVAALSGHFDRGARMLAGLTAPPPGHREQEVSAALTHLGAGDIAGASRWMRRIANPDNRDDFNPEFAQAARCAAAGLELRSGNAGAANELRAAIEGTQGWRCALSLADGLQGAARLAALDDAERTLGAPWGAWHTLATLLRLDAGARDHALRRIVWVDPRMLLTEPFDVFVGRAPGLERAVYDALAREPDAALTPMLRLTRASLGCSLAAFESVVGTAAEARALHARAAADLAAASVSGDASVLNHLPGSATFVAELGAAIELRAGNVEGARAALANATFGDGPGVTLLPFLRGETDGAPWTERYATDATLDDWSDLGPGGGDAFVALRATSHWNPFKSATVAFGVRRLASGRAPVAAWLSWGERGPCWRCYWRSAATEAAHTAMTARALGRDDVRAEAERSLAAFHTALLRRDTAVAALLIESL